MTEKEFDIQVRNILQEARENVPSKVWKGVAAGLDGRSRVVPLRFWGYAGALAAAAAVALFVLHKPAVQPVLEEHSNPSSIFVSEVISGEPEPEVNLVPRKEPQLLAQIAPRPKQPAKAQEQPVVAQPQPQQEAQQPQQVAKRPEEPAKPAEPKQQPVRDTQDNACMNQLAFEQQEQARPSGRGLSLSAFGNIQSNERGAVQGNLRRFGVPPLNAGEGIYNESPEVSFNLPFSIGVGLRYNFTPRWAVGTGLRYTNLQRTFVGDYVGNGFNVLQTDIDNEQHWLGVPLNVYYNIVNKGRWRVHSFVGGSAEWLLDNDFLVHNSPSDMHYHQKGTKTQWSGAIGLGVEFKLSPLVGIYLDPSFRYFFDTENQPRSLRTIQPLRFDIEAGVRFSFGE